MKPGSAEQVHKVCLGTAIAPWMAALLRFLADAKGLATGLVVLGVVLDLVAHLVMWFVSENQKRDRE